MRRNIAELQRSQMRLRQFAILIEQIGVCLTMTIISALASFDVVYMSTQGGPGTSTMVPGVQVYRLAFTQQSVGLASALAVTLMILVLLVVGPLQRLVNGKEQ